MNTETPQVEHIANDIVWLAFERGARISRSNYDEMKVNVEALVSNMVSRTRSKGGK